MRIPLLVTFAILVSAQWPATAEEPSAPQALVKIKVLELDLAKVRKLNSELRTPEGVQAFDPERIKNAGVIDKNDPILSAIRAFEKQQVAKVLAEPTLALAFDKPARYINGGEFPIPSPPDGKGVLWYNYGTEAEVTAHDCGDNRVEVKFKVRISEIDTTREVTVGDVKVPSLYVFSANSSFTADWDETRVVCVRHGRDVMGIVLVTPSRVDTMATRPVDTESRPVR